MSFLARLAAIKYPETEGCCYIVMRANWIEHWVKYIQSGLINILVRGMVRSYTDLAAQHAATRPDRLQTLSPPPVPQGLRRFTSRGIAHTSQEASHPTVTFIDGAKRTMLDHMVPKVTAVETLSTSARLSRRTGPSVSHERSLQVTPPRMPTDRSSLETREKETGMQGSDYDNPENSADRDYLSLSVSRDVRAGGDTEPTDIESVHFQAYSLPLRNNVSETRWELFSPKSLIAKKTSYMITLQTVLIKARSL